MRLVFSRAAAARTLLAAASLAAAVTTVLLTAFALYAQLLPQAGVRAAVADAPAEDRSLRLTASAGGDGAELAARDAVARDLLGGTLAGVPLEVYTGGYGIGQRLPDGLPGVDPGPDGAYAVVAYLSGLPDHAELVGGAWPEPVPADQPAQVALPVEVAGTLELAVGDRVAIRDEIAKQDRPVVVAGLWRPDHPDHPYWELASAPVERGGWGPFVVHQDEFVARYQQLATAEWVALAAPAGLAAAGMPAVSAGLDRLAADVAAHRDDPQGTLGSSVDLRTGLDELAGQLELATVVNRSGMVLPAALLAVIAGYVLVLVARLVAAHRQGENALLRARGGSRRQLASYGMVEAMLVVSPAALIGAPLGTRLVVWADENAGGRGLGLATDLAPYGWLGSPLAWVVALAAACGCALALVAPAAGRGRTWLAEQQERSRPSRRAALQRAGGDVALVGLAVLAWSQLRQYETTVLFAAGGAGMDPLLVAAPVVAVLAGTAVALRLLPVVTRVAVRLVARGRALPGLLGMWQADRRPHAGPVLLLVLAVATAVLAPTVAATWQQSQQDQAAQLVGADLRLVGQGADLAGRVAALAEEEPVAAVMPAARSTIRLPAGEQVPLLALDSVRAPEVTRLRSDRAAGPEGSPFDGLAAGRPRLGGVRLPEGARRLVGRLHFDAPPGSAVHRGQRVPDLLIAGAESLRPSVHLADARGVISSRRLGTVEPGGWWEIDVPLPVGVESLVGLGAGLRLPVSAYGFNAELTFEPTRVSWRWEGLAAVAADGVAHPLELPDSWQIVHHPDQPGGPSVPELRRDGPAVTTTVDLDLHPPQQLPFLLTEPVQVPPVPAVLTPDVLAGSGAAVGDVVDFEVGDITARVLRTVTALPGTADGDGIAVDLAWLSMQRYLDMRPPPEPDEWWLATSRPRRVAAAAEQLPVTVLDRRAEAERLLGDPLGSGMLLTLWTAAVGGTVLAAFGLAVDARANAVRRRRELAVLHTLGASPSGLARALVTEQAVLAGLGVLAGVAVGIGVAAAMGTALVLTPAGAVPVPEPLLALSPARLATPAAGLLAAAVLLGGMVALRARREVVAGALRIGGD